MKAVSFLALFLGVFVLSVLTAAAQVPTATPDDALRTFEVRLPVTVTNKKELITGLQRGDHVAPERLSW